MKNKMQVIDSCVFSFFWKGGEGKKPSAKIHTIGNSQQHFLFLTFDWLRGEEIMWHCLDTWAQILDVIDGALKIL